MGLPLFSGSMVIADAVFLSDHFYMGAARRARRLVRRVGPTAPDASHPVEGSLVPRQQARPAEVLDRT
jgi:hypothetical protein